MNRYVCIHGHFYQPPRENPWLGVIEVQDSAAPYHDWNERVTAESYRPNSRSRILDDQGWIEDIVNNYGRMSFNFGPTLLSWLEVEAADVYQAVLEGDKQSAARFGGHGSAIAQAFSHLIMPLANSRDKRTQVLWGIADFERRFGRRPEGMWLPETAVDLESLDIMAEQAIKFTILAPHQALRVRPAGQEQWQAVTEAGLNTRRPYRVSLPSGRAIAVFFYDGPTARAVAFEGLLESGERLVERMLDVFDEHDDSPQLAHIATDGETYGHHHRFGDMALAHALDRFESEGEVTLTNYGRYLEMFPPAYEAEVAEDTSWSCAHGVERWRSDCGDHTGGQPAWNQAWREPLRRAFDWLRDELVPLFENLAGELLADPWAARDDYAQVFFDRSPQNVEAFLARHASHPLDELERTRALKLLEMQLHAVLMYTSCGWFFNDVSGIETVQVLSYAARAVQLAQELAGDHLEDRILAVLAEARSNVPEQGDARRIYERYVLTCRVDLPKALAHYAVSSLFEDYGPRSKVFSYTVEQQDFRLEEAGRTKLAMGVAHIVSDVTLESTLLSFAAVHLGDQNISGGLRPFESIREYNELTGELRQTFARGELTDVVHLLDDLFPGKPFSLRSLFRDEQRKIVRLILQPALDEAELVYRAFYEDHIPLFRFLTHIEYPLPNRFHAAADLALHLELRRALEADALDRQEVALLIEEARLVGIEVDREALGFELQETLARLADGFAARPSDSVAAQRLLIAVDLAGSAGLPVDLSQVQDVYYRVSRAQPPAFDPAAETGKVIELLGGALKIRPPAAKT